MVEATAECLLGNPRSIIKIDCAEFQHSHEIAKLIGSPPGYLGHRETHPLLSQEVLNQHHTETMKLSFILFDEIEKASDALWNLLLGILDKATLTLGDNRKVDFSHALIFMTSNLGASEMSALLNPRIGFQGTEMARQQANGGDNGVVDEKLSGKLARSGVEAARKKFTPEFMNRLDKIVTFKALGTEELRLILDIELGIVQKRIFNSAGDRPFIFKVADAGKAELLREGTDIKYGARHLKRAIERMLVQPMSNLIATGQVRGGDWIKVDFDHDGKKLSFTKEAEGLPLHAMAELSENSATTPALALAGGAIAETIRTKTAVSKRN